MLGRERGMFNRGQGECRQPRAGCGPYRATTPDPQEKVMTRFRRTMRSLRTAMTRPVPGVDGCGPTRVRDYPVTRRR